MKKSELRQLIKEEIKQIISEKFINLIGEDNIKPYIQDIWNIMQRTYKSIGGFKTANSPEELLNKVSFAKLVKKDNKIIAAILYKDKLGRKTIAGGSDGSTEGVKWIKKVFQEEIQQQRSWGEFSGKMESLMLKYGGIPIPNSEAESILGKDIIEKNKDGYHYTRLINGEPHEKIIIGHLGT
jgi:hypothetical protein